jgi:ESCRT-I complex subunit TSG101
MTGHLISLINIFQKSSIDDFLTVLRGVFAKDPPVISKQQLQAAQQAQAPPPVPPLPKYNTGSPQPPSHSPGFTQGAPPALPPKASSASSPPPRPTAGDQGPPLPPLPPQIREASPQFTSAQKGKSPVLPSYGQPNQRYSLTNPAMQLFPPSSQFRTHELETPVSPIQPDAYDQRVSSFPQTHHQQWMPPHPSQYNPQQAQFTNPPSFQAGPAQYHQQASQQQLKRPTPMPPVDLLTSPLDVTIPSQSGNLDPLPAPPIPPNPQKDAILKAISHTLVAETHRNLDSNKTAVSSLIAQQSALRQAYSVLQAEIEQLQGLDATLDNNEHVLRSAMQNAENVMKDAAGRPRPDIDDVLVCPTVVGGQLYNVVADEKACEAARVALIKGLDRGRVSLDVFVKQTRSLAREEFLKKALIRKIARGMGLEEQPW